MRLILCRALAGGAIALILWRWFFPAPAPVQQRLMIIVGIVFILLLPIQYALTFTRVADRTQRAFQHSFDILLSGLLVFCTGGIYSPFSFLLGLIIITSGTFAVGMLPVALTILACFSYLAAIYGRATVMQAPLDTQQALHALLQVSALMLVGGVMGFIAKRHARLRDSSEQAVQRHHHLKDLHARIMRSMREGVVVLDDRMQISEMNGAAEQLLGSRSIAALSAVPELKAFLQHPAPTTFQCDDRRGERSLRVAAMRLPGDDEATWLLTLVDITDIRNLKRKLVQQEKMAALGKMAAMLAHEIRNPVQTMAQGLDLMTQKGVKSEEIQAILREEMLRLNRLASTMLDYSSPLQPAPGPAMMANVMQSALHQALLRQGGDVCLQCNIKEMRVDIDHFRLVVDNLLSNALVNRIDDSTVDIQLNADNGDWILSVSNAGEIPASVRNSIFEPFVSGCSHGIGLGLATIKHVCDINEWSVDVDSKGGFTCFNVSGPLLITDAARQAPQAGSMEGNNMEVAHG